MHGLMAVYICPVHGKVLEDECEHGEHIDSEHDEVYPFVMHGDGCWQEVRPQLHEGQQCFEQVSDERYQWWIYSHQDEDANDESEYEFE